MSQCLDPSVRLCFSRPCLEYLSCCTSTFHEAHTPAVMFWSLGGEGLIYGIEKALYAQAGLVWSVHMWTQQHSRRCCLFVAALTMQTIEPCNILRRHRDRPTTSHSVLAATLPRSRTASTRARAEHSHQPPSVQATSAQAPHRRCWHRYSRSPRFRAEA